MPRNGSNIYSKPSGTTAVAGATIESAKFNSVIDDFVTDANTARPVVAGGTGATNTATARANLGVATSLDDVGTVLGATLTYTTGQAGTVAAGDYVLTKKEGFSYEVAASGATDHHLTTSGGVKLKVLSGVRGYNVKAFGAFGNGVNDTAAIQAAVDATEVNGGGYIYFPTFDEDYRVTTSIKFMLGDIRIFGDKGMAFTHPFTDGTDRLFRKGNLIGAVTADSILDLGDYATGAGDTSPYASNPSRNLAQSWTVDHLTFRGDGTREVDGVALTGVQNGPHRIHSFDVLSGYNLRNGIYVPPKAAGISIQVANLNVTNSTFSFGDKAIFAEGQVYGTAIDRNNFEANQTGCIHGAFNGAISITNNMMENTQNPVNLEPVTNLALTAHGNYFEYHPTSEYLYRIKGYDSYLKYNIDVSGDIISSDIPDYPVVLENAGRWWVDVNERYPVLIKSVGAGETFVVGKGSTIMGGKGLLNMDRMLGTIVADIDGGFARPDLSDLAIHSYPHNPATRTIEQTPLGPMEAVDLANGFRVDHGENIQGKLVASTFMIRSLPGVTVAFPPEILRARTYAGAFVVGPNAPLDYIANDISQGEWRHVMILWKTTSSVQQVELYADTAGLYQVAGVVTQVLGLYAGDGSDGIKQIKAYTLNGEMSGSNANGNWIKRSDGTMECRQSFAASSTVSATNTVQGLSLYQNINTWTFPLAFNASPIVEIEASQGAAGTLISNRALSVGTTSAGLHSDSLQSPATWAISKTARAVGRWRV